MVVSAMPGPAPLHECRSGNEFRSCFGVGSRPPAEVFHRRGLPVGCFAWRQRCGGSGCRCGARLLWPSWHGLRHLLAAHAVTAAAAGGRGLGAWDDAPCVRAEVFETYPLICFKKPALRSGWVWSQSKGWRSLEALVALRFIELARRLGRAASLRGGSCECAPRDLVVT